MKKTITIFGSSLPKEGDKEFEDAYLLGSLLAKGNFNICTGGYRGIMHAASKGAKENGAEAIGITVDLWGATPSEYLTQEIKCENLFERITKLIEAGDGYIILQGGTGTLLELSAVWELMNKGLITKKLTACHSAMWSDIVTVIDKQIKRENRTAGLIECFDNVEAIADYFKRNIG